MEHIDTEQHLSKEEQYFNDLMRRGEDFMKIEIFRNAKRCYNEALEIHVNNNLAIQKISNCEQLIRKESRTILTILAVFAAITGVVCLIVLI